MNFKEYIDSLLDNNENWKIVDFKFSPIKIGLSFKYGSVEITSSIREDNDIDSLKLMFRNSIKNELIDIKNSSHKYMDSYYRKENRNNNIDKIIN